MSDLQIDYQTKKEILNYYEKELLINLGIERGLNVSKWTSREKLTEILLPKLTKDDFFELLREEDVGFFALSKLTKQEIINNIDIDYLKQSLESSDIPSDSPEDIRNYFLQELDQPLLVLIGMYYSLRFVFTPAIERQIVDVSNLMLTYKEATKSSKKKLREEFNFYYSLGVISEKANLQQKLWKKEELVSYLMFKGMAHPKLFDQIEKFSEDDNHKTPKNISDKNREMKQLIKFNNVYGMDELKEELRLLVIYPLKHPELAKKYHKKMGGGILLYGPPGCGKTFISKAIAGECGYPFVEIKASEILSKWMGESEQKIAAVFKKARTQKPSILFIDEVDSLMFNRANSDQTSMNSIVNSFLREISDMEKEGILVIAATNFPFNLDPAAIRSGRFTRKIYVGPPDLKARAGLLKFFTRDKPFGKLDFEKLAKKTEWFSNADIEDLVNKVLEIPYREAIKATEKEKTKSNFFEEDLKIPYNETRKSEERKANMNDFLEILKTKTPSTTPYFVNCEKFLAEIKSLDQYGNLLSDLNRFRNSHAKKIEKDSREKLNRELSFS